MAKIIEELINASIEMKALLKNENLKDYQRSAYELAAKLIDDKISETIIGDY